MQGDPRTWDRDGCRDDVLLGTTVGPPLTGASALLCVWSEDLPLARIVQYRLAQQSPSPKVCKVNRRSLSQSYKDNNSFGLPLARCWGVDRRRPLRLVYLRGSLRTHAQLRKCLNLPLGEASRPLVHLTTRYATEELVAPLSVTQLYSGVQTEIPSVPQRVRAWGQ